MHPFSRGKMLTKPFTMYFRRVKCNTTYNLIMRFLTCMYYLLIEFHLTRQKLDQIRTTYKHDLSMSYLNFLKAPGPGCPKDQLKLQDQLKRDQDLAEESQKKYEEIEDFINLMIVIFSNFLNLFIYWYEPV